MGLHRHLYSPVHFLADGHQLRGAMAGAMDVNMEELPVGLHELRDKDQDMVEYPCHMDYINNSIQLSQHLEGVALERVGVED